MIIGGELGDGLTYTFPIWLVDYMKDDGDKK